MTTTNLSHTAAAVAIINYAIRMDGKLLYPVRGGQRARALAAAGKGEVLLPAVKVGPNWGEQTEAWLISGIELARKGSLELAANHLASAARSYGGSCVDEAGVENDWRETFGFSPKAAAEAA